MRRFFAFTPLFCLIILGCGPDKGAEIEKLKKELQDVKASHVEAPKPAVELRTVSGQVRVGDSPLKGGKIVLMGANGHGFGGAIDDQGRYEFKNVPVGSYTVSIHTRTAASPAQLPEQFSDAYGSGLEVKVEADKPETVFHPILTAKKP